MYSITKMIIDLHIHVILLFRTRVQILSMRQVDIMLQSAEGKRSLKKEIKRLKLVKAFITSNNPTYDSPRNTNPSANPNPNLSTNLNPDTNTSANPNLNLSTNLNPDTNANSNPNPESLSSPNPSTKTTFIPNSNPNLTSNTITNANANHDLSSNTITNANPNLNLSPIINSEPNPPLITISLFSAKHSLDPIPSAHSSRIINFIEYAYNIFHIHNKPGILITELPYFIQFCVSSLSLKPHKGSGVGVFRRVGGLTVGGLPVEGFVGERVAEGSRSTDANPNPNTNPNSNPNPESLSNLNPHDPKTIFIPNPNPNLTCNEVGRVEDTSWERGEGFGVDSGIRIGVEERLEEGSKDGAEAPLDLIHNQV
jgi:hypothetical protein